MTTVISVRFRNGFKTYSFDPRDLTVAPGQDVIVETAQGPEFAQCAEGNHQVPDSAVVTPLRPVLRIATDNDRHTAAYNRSREQEAFDICQKKILQHKLEMKLVRVECSFDGSKILFFFTADGRVDFRELVKDLAGVFRSRIELRQIGVRDEAKMLGGLGICGRPFCCSAYMDEFVPVSIKMAKTQNLSLNPTKISGTCGRLMCCLKYEQAAYEDAAKRLPKSDSFVLTPDGPGNVSDVNLLKETVNVRLDDQPESPRCYHNCELCVLRNGKGSRDGIAIPAQRPERYMAPAAEPAAAPPFPGYEDEVPAREDAESPRRRRRRGSRGRGKAEAAPTAAEGGAGKISADKGDRRKDAAGGDGKPSDPDRDAGARREGGRRRRGGRSSGQGTPSEQSQPQPHSQAQNPEGSARRSARHRGGRRRRGGAQSGGAES